MLLQNQSGGTVEFTQGDVVTLALLATNDQGVPVNLTGASLSTQILGPNDIGTVIFPNNQHTLGNQTSAPGTFTLALTAANTNACGLGNNKQILTTATISSVVTTFRGEQILTVWPEVPTQ
jgi:hypothetical protein